MKAIAFAILCAAYLLIPQHEADAWGRPFMIINAITWGVCIFGFWWCIFFEAEE